MGVEGVRSDQQMPKIIQRIDVIKHWPMLFYLYPKDPSNIYMVTGWRPFFTGALSTTVALLFYFNKIRANPVPFGLSAWNFWYRGIGSFLIGFGYGFYHWADWQRMHNAYVAERLMRRYPDSKNLTSPNIGEVVGKQTSQRFYKS